MVIRQLFIFDRQILIKHNVFMILLHYILFIGRWSSNTKYFNHYNIIRYFIQSIYCIIYIRVILCLQTLYRPDLTSILIKTSRCQKMKDRVWVSVSMSSFNNVQEIIFLTETQTDLQEKI